MKVRGVWRWGFMSVILPLLLVLSSLVALPRPAAAAAEPNLAVELAQQVAANEKAWVASGAATLAGRFLFNASEDAAGGAAIGGGADVGSEAFVPDFQYSFITNNNGDAFPIPEGASGPYPADNGLGIQYLGGSGGNGLNSRVTGIRVMDSTATKFPYPNGYVTYMNVGNQAVDPYTGRTLRPSDPLWHLQWGSW